MDISEVTDKVKQFLVEEFEIENDKIKPEATLKTDLGIDSLDFVDIVVIIDDIFGFQINSDDIQKIDTFGEFCNYIQEKTVK
jgi:acyl carrier protein